MSSPNSIEPARIEQEDLDRIGHAGREDPSDLSSETIPVYEHPDAEAERNLSAGEIFIPGVRPDGEVVKFRFVLDSAIDGETGTTVWRL